MRPAAVSRKARQSGRTREALLSHSLRLVASRGFSRTSIDHIGRAAGVTKGAMYWHFASKDDLFLAILDRIRERWQQVVHAPVSARQTPTARLVQLFESYGELFRGSPEICLFLQQALLDRGPVFVPVSETRRRRLSKRKRRKSDACRPPRRADIGRTAPHRRRRSADGRRRNPSHDRAQRRGATA
jgi:AcrR family transcriptional regulator